MQQAVNPDVELAGDPSYYSLIDAPTAEPRPSAMSAAEEVIHMTAEVRRLRIALEDVIALAQGGGECRHRVIQMQRRAIAALSGTDKTTKAVQSSTPLS